MAPPTVRFRPGRYLAAFVVIVATLYGLVFFTGDGSPTPKLGIDLQGGTRVTLTARTETGAAPTPDQLDLARQIIDQRVNGLGVSGAEVVQDGSNLVITVPGEEGDQARSLGQTARLFFRPVIGGPIPAGPQPGAPGQPGATAPAPGGGTGAGTPGQSPAGQSTPIAASEAGQPAQPPVPAPPPGDPGTSADPRQAQAIAEAKALRQSEDPAVQEQAALALDCSVEDPLRGYDDPTRPLVTCNREGTEKYLLGPAILSGTDVASATPNPNPQGVGWVINLAFKSEAASTWADYTSANVNNLNAVVLDSQVVSALRIVQPLLDGQAQISGNFNQESATDFANILRYGSLPLSFDVSEAQTVSATLGLASLQAGLIAGVVGLILVFAYSLFYYRALGVLTILSLILSGLVVYAVLVLLGRGIGFTLDLAGVAGFIVAIGITADSFVVFFERIKDEVREGRSFRSAVPRGWLRARRTILSADAVSFLAAVVLYVLAVGQVKGFAFTLGMSTVLDLIVVFLVTHPLLALASNSRLFSSPAWSGLGEAVRHGRRPGAPGPPRPGGRRPAPAGAGNGTGRGAGTGTGSGTGSARGRAGRGGAR
ncbi:protein translocase subunit SecD [Actinomycetospora cinnamomea]|uniref:Protein translocase subunit SecD n=1 Tax=Actinomycetospora cinnamomea TaxID=663609 RepID=A0A2U1E9A2_9PSEU|nr:protein translocase subunit SecD [Actinomycetospora cinnamomea]PVY96523.1 preprotein translocase subunit SecD [Actinomycetospora cinnamomea]